MSITAWIAVLVIIATIYCLIKRYETRLVLFTAGLFLCCISMKPMAALDQFAKSMTNASLIMAICGAMGFAYVVTHTSCDRHLVSLLAAPLKRLGILLIPAATAVTFFVNIAIPSAAGCAAAVGATFIPVMIRAGIRPAAAGAAILMGTYGSILSPGMSHNNFVAGISKMNVMDLISLHTPFSLIMMGIGLVGITIVCLVLRDNKPTAEELAAYSAKEGGAPIEKINFLKALAPLIPLIILVHLHHVFGHEELEGAVVSDGSLQRVVTHGYHLVITLVTLRHRDGSLTIHVGNNTLWRLQFLIVGVGDDCADDWLLG